MLNLIKLERKIKCCRPSKKLKEQYNEHLYTLPQPNQKIYIYRNDFLSYVFPCLHVCISSFPPNFPITSNFYIFKWPPKARAPFLSIPTCPNVNATSSRQDSLSLLRRNHPFLTHSFSSVLRWSPSLPYYYQISIVFPLVQDYIPFSQITQNYANFPSIFAK